MDQNLSGVYESTLVEITQGTQIQIVETDNGRTSPHAFQPTRNFKNKSTKITSEILEKNPQIPSSSILDTTIQKPTSQKVINHETPLPPFTPPLKNIHFLLGSEESEPKKIKLPPLKPYFSEHIVIETTFPATLKL
jgi:hypothetical protein